MDCRKMSKIVSLSFVNCSKDFMSDCTIKVNRASWRPMDCMEKQLRAFQGMLGRRLVVWPWYSSVVWHFFQLLLPFAIIYYDPLNVENCLECLSPSNQSASPYCSCDLRVARNILWSNSLRKLIIEKTRLFGKFFPRIRCSLLERLLSTLGNSLLWDSIC